MNTIAVETMEPVGPAAWSAVAMGLPPSVYAVGRGPDRVELEGRELLSRAELARVTGELKHTLYKWWVARESNGHPEGVLVEGRPYFELEQWRRWRAEHGADRRTINGRVHISSAALAHETGEPLANLQHWYNERARNGHPEAVHLGRTRYVDEAAWHRWYAEHKARLRAGLTEVDRSGDPDELIGIVEAARVLGVKPRTLSSYIARNQFIEPDQTEELSADRQRRWWTRRRVWKRADERTWPRQPDRRTTVGDADPPAQPTAQEQRG